MKIVCESCGAKYSIADEKVAGKVFKIRCKKCSAVIVVKGDQPTVGAAPQSLDAGGEAVWHVVVGGEQQGPFAPRQIGELLAEGKIDWEAYVWREGMDGWQPAKDVPNLVSAVMAESESSEPAKPAREAEPLFGGSGDMGADPFASSDDGGLSGVIGQAAAAAVPAAGASVGGADLFADVGRGFGGGAADDDDARGAGSSGGTSPRVGGDGAMTGQRNENSVLFSLSNLQALATGSGAAPSSGGSKPGMAAGEGSGLIDIRALANATQTVGGGGGGAAAQPRNKVEDLLAVGSSGTAFSATSLAAPVAVEKRENRGMFLAMGAAILVLAGVVTYLVARGNPTPTAQLTPAAEPAQTGAVNTQPTPSQPTAAPQAAEPTPNQPTPPPTEPAPPTPAAAADDEPARAEGDDKRDHGDHASRRERRKERDAKDKEEKSAPSAAAAPAEKPEKKPTSSSGDKSLDDLLDTALSGKGSKPAAKPAAEALPPTPSRDDVLNAMKGVTAKVQACGGGQSGVAMTKVNVAGPTGKVNTVDVSGQFAGTPAASCISKEVAKAKFNKFSQPSFSFSYPFKI